ncbi:hypothetical protein ASPZODRAFT_77027 [Penicilliopsis zonata CBS 506.65]|uniref:Aminopeptidase n=1 Tax=Penicilliopsis zonata CBS 506.65 TaxID=1073090 RepID=A0A1L9S5I6_9EURO|nr:hypothetical protein ASPZODRAFT_77027 [Penicilliopsis zonata CBS 506.65]OJJ42425.1 hypothetical protein ASPZODRAFT_77027 [Penicilliopsis zonata CBS 506.65]
MSSRLPVNVRPVHYDLGLELDLETCQFQGTVDIRLVVQETTSMITLHAVDLAIHDPRISGVEIPMASLSHNAENQTASIKLEQPLSSGETATLSLRFTGTLDERMAGLYLSRYTDANDKTHRLAVTQMEPTYARRAFPCFDEPALKASFAVTVIAASHLACLSNMDVKSVEYITSNTKRVTFSTSPAMSTYIVAILVGELDMLETDTARIPVRLVAAPGREIDRLGPFALDLTARTLALYEQRFDSPFPLSKMDIVAVPDYVGAMENWGLLVYREADVLVDVASSTAKQRVVPLIQHELAHQWFGNLVTMEWWDGLWLNEGFADWMSRYACDALYPDWRVWEMYVAESLQRGLSLDSLRSSHPLQVAIHREEEIGQIFDAISYTKGACILRMIAGFLGQDEFLRGVQLYIRRHAFGTATTDDLWDALTQSSGGKQDVRQLMSVWTSRVGFPVLTVTEDATANTVHVRQNRFLATGDVQPDEDETLYPVFLGLRTSTGVDSKIHKTLLLTDRECTLKLDSLDFFKLNADHTGFYRTAYTPSRLRRLGQAARQRRLPVVDRVGLVADAAALAAAGYQGTTSVLALLQELQSEPEYFVWKQMVASLASIRAAWIFSPDETMQRALHSFERQLVSAKAHQLGWVIDDDDDDDTHDSHLSRQFKTLLFESAVRAGDERAHEAAMEMFRRFQTDRTAIHADLRAAVFAAAIMTGGEEAYHLVLNEYRTAPTSDQRITALQALGEARDPLLLQRTIDMLLSSEVRLQDMHVPMRSLCTHRDGILALWEWLTLHWETVQSRLSVGLVLFGMVVGLCTSGFTTDEQREQVQRFFQDKACDLFDKALQQSLDEVRMKARWVQRDAEEVKRWLHREGYPIDMVPKQSLPRYAVGLAILGQMYMLGRYFF